MLVDPLPYLSIDDCCGTAKQPPGCTCPAIPPRVSVASWYRNKSRFCGDDVEGVHQAAMVPERSTTYVDSPFQNSRLSDV